VKIKFSMNPCTVTGTDRQEECVTWNRPKFSMNPCKVTGTDRQEECVTWNRPKFGFGSTFAVLWGISGRNSRPETQESGWAEYDVECLPSYIGSLGTYKQKLSEGQSRRTCCRSFMKFINNYN
jgi:hypothetical protein